MYTKTYEIKNKIFCANEKETSRINKEESHEVRCEFQRDRDRILYSKEFRRLSGKTQVFVSGFDDHMRTRLTHTLEVAQIADTIARALGLNEVLTEAIAYGHDVGHTPFGHAGERILNSIMNGCRDIYGYNKQLPKNTRGFKHNWQSLRVLTDLEKINTDYKGLNLTKFTLWGVLNHSSKKLKGCKHLANDLNEGESAYKCRLNNKNIPCDNNGKYSVDYYETNYNSILSDETDWTVEGAIVATADEIAQRHHDVEDAILAGIIKMKGLTEYFQKCFGAFITDDDQEMIKSILDNHNNKFDIALSKLSKLIVNFYTSYYINNLKEKFSFINNKFNLIDTNSFHQKKSEIYEYINKILNSSINDYFGIKTFEKKPLFKECDGKLQKYLFSIIINSQLAQSMDGKSDFIIRKLFKAYLSNPQQLPDNTILKAYFNLTNTSNPNESKDIKPYIARQRVLKLLMKGDKEINSKMLRTVCDFIAGMTDQFAMSQYDILYGTKEYKNY